MTVGDFLRDATQTLREHGIPSARLDALILLEDHTGRDRASLLAHPELVIERAAGHDLQTAVQQRATHLPLAYIRGSSMFYGRKFIITPAVLVPRPETETMIDMLTKISLPEHVTIADIGTGSGCIGITAALELPQATVHLYDIDPAALAVAKRNAKALQADVTIAQTDLLRGMADTPDILLTNLPYVPDDYPINDAARHEPKLALFAGSDGLELYRSLWQQVSKLIPKPQHIFTESLGLQHGKMIGLTKAAGYVPAAVQGLIQHFTRV